MFIDIRIDYHSRNENKHIIISIILYRTPNIHIKLFTDKLTDLLYCLRKNIIGDFNIDTSSAIINPNMNVNNFQTYFYLISILL